MPQPAGATEAERLNNAIAGTLHKPGGPLDKLAAEWVQWWNNDRITLEAGGVVLLPFYWGELVGWWMRYKAAWREEHEPANAVNPDAIQPRVSTVVNDEARRVIEANSDVARAAAKKVSEAATAALPWAVIIGAIAAWWYFGRSK